LDTEILEESLSTATNKLLVTLLENFEPLCWPQKASRKERRASIYTYPNFQVYPKSATHLPRLHNLHQALASIHEPEFRILPSHSSLKKHTTPMMQILLIGKGGREHALAWKLNQSPKASHIYVVPGNGGTARGLSKVSNIDDVKEDDYPALVELAKKLGIDLVVVGPDQAVVDGIEGYFRAGAHLR
jgi:hypothetical protein